MVVAEQSIPEAGARVACRGGGSRRVRTGVRTGPAGSGRALRGRKVRFDISEEHPADDLFFLLGADSLAGLPGWRDAERLVTLTSFLWIRRPGHPGAPPPAVLDSLPGLRLEFVDTVPVGHSSKDIRARARRGLPLRGFVPESVEARIVSLGLWRQPDP